MLSVLRNELGCKFHDWVFDPCARKVLDLSFLNSRSGIVESPVIVDLASLILHAERHRIVSLAASLRTRSLVVVVEVAALADLATALGLR